MEAALSDDRSDPEFSEAEIQRYSRHILLREIGGGGQAALRRARVLVIGAGGIAHRMESLGVAKTASAASAARAINPEVEIVEHSLRLAAPEAETLIPAYDIVCDGSDNFATRYLVADTCVRARRVLVSAAVLRFEGQLSVFKPHLHPSGPCYRCLYPEAPPPGLSPSCAEAGVLGAVTGVMGTLQATETIKEILGLGESLSGRLLLLDALATRFRTIRIPRDPQCPVCSMV
jgi:molybdopterin/thiamine biosynthesis adenylyltransferase